MPTLRPTQVEASNAIYLKPTLLLADVGAGKTATALHTLGRRRLLIGRQRTLVLGTTRICDTVWGAEVALWLPGFTFESVAGKMSGNRKAIMEDPSVDIVALNYENVIWAVKEYGAELPRMFPQLIIDESSKLENPASKTFKALDPLLSKFKWRLPMTGSPRANHLHDLWGNVYLADLGKALGEYKRAFLQKYFHPVMTSRGNDWIPLSSTEAAINERITRWGAAYRMPFEWHDPVEIDVVIPLNGKVRMIQGVIDKQLKTEPDVEFMGITLARDGNRIHTKMLQLSSGFIYDDTGQVVNIHDDKIKALADIVAEAHGEPIMVIFQFDHERDAILKRFPQARLLDNADTLAEWNAGQIEMLLAHPNSCGHGLNAQFSGCDLQVWFTPNPDAEKYGQTIGRLNRPGNPKTIRVIRLIMQGTKDRACYNVVAARQRGEHATLEAFE